MAVTLRDVARAAGVSAATASRALSTPDLVAPERRDAVRRAARELGYRPNRAARELITGRSGHLCLVVPDLGNPFFSTVAKAVQARARAAGHAVVVADAEEDPLLEAELVAQLGGQADGVVLCSPRMSADDLAAVAADGPPVLLVNRESPGLPSVVVDNRDAVRQAVRHLHALGHRRIAYAGGPHGSWSDARRRDGLAALDLDVEVVDLGAHAPVFAGGVAAADLAVAGGATAVLAHNDLMALGLVDRLRARGRRVPDDVSVVGVDDSPVATLVSPALTTVAMPLALLGRTAVDLLLGPHDDATRVLPVELVVRGTTAPPPDHPETR